MCDFLPVARVRCCRRQCRHSAVEPLQTLKLLSAHLGKQRRRAHEVVLTDEAPHLPHELPLRLVGRHQELSVMRHGKARRFASTQTFLEARKECFFF
ncbi:MAG: hypothetical protein B7Z68_04625 [Acidobacteria bacterium 21-70-11]|nr:MAG: hypothetical protein B7Z68_04625 [Acidobacteria bacterium 21-70-11]OYW05390.1 MAG: hypothetical protein B7Z61_06360 [Acidobacteria bacterium 37-71-11]